MATKAENLLRILEENLGKLLLGAEISRVGEVRIKLAAEQLIETMLRLRDDEALSFCQLIDLCGIDYSDYRVGGEELPRFATIYHLLSLRHNWRLRVQVFAPADMPVLSSVNGVWPAANWYEREAFDLFGIIYDGHDDLRRILTDYGFIGHPFRKDFPLHGHVEMRYDAATGRVVYAPVTIDNRITVPRVSRSDHRYEHPGQPRG